MGPAVNTEQNSGPNPQQIGAGPKKAQLSAAVTSERAEGGAPRGRAEMGHTAPHERERCSEWCRD